MINRRLYLESPTEIQRLFIVPYKLGTIAAKTIEMISLRFREHKTIMVTQQEAARQ